MVCNKSEHRVLDLVSEMEAKDYRLGWVFHRCEELNLLTTLANLQSSGRLLNMWALDKRKKLEVELVPNSSWGDNFRNLEPEGWLELKKEVFNKANRRCEICGGIGTSHPVECHEIWSFDTNNHIQKLVGLIALCPLCHCVKHIGRTDAVGKGKKARLHMAQVNGWSEVEVSNHIDEQFSIWRQRNLVNWKLDLSYVDKLLSKKLKFKIVRVLV